MNKIKLVFDKIIEIISLNVVDSHSELKFNSELGNYNLYRNLIFSLSLYITVYFFGYILFYSEFQKYNQSTVTKLSNGLSWGSYLSLYPFNAFVLLVSLFLFVFFSFICSYLLFFILDRPKYLAKGLYFVHIKLLEVLFLLSTVLFIFNRILSVLSSSDTVGFLYITLFTIVFVFFMYKMKKIYGLYFERNPYLIPKRRSFFVCYVFLGICLGLGFGVL